MVADASCQAMAESRSIPGGSPTVFVVTNHSQVPLTLFDIEPNGNSYKFGEILPAHSLLQAADAGYVFGVTDGGRCIRMFTVTPSLQITIG